MELVKVEFSAGFIIFIVFAIAFIIQLWFYLSVFRRVAFFKKGNVAGAAPPASIVICARNEDDNLVEFFPAVLAQDYPEYEVVVVNDCSFDNTADILEEFSKKYERLKVVTIKEDDNFSHGKKFALMVGIKGAKHEHLLLTDADCKPNGKNWLRTMMSNFDERTDIVLGYGAYEKSKGLLNKLIRFDTFYIALQYMGWSMDGKTYMGVGRNLSYRKSLFFKYKGFRSHYHIESGDDDLFINEAATAANTRVEVSPESFTTSKPKRTMSGWVRQKRRHLTTAKHYKGETKFRLGMLSFSQYLFWITFVTLLIMQVNLYVVLGLWLFRFIIQLLIFKKSMVQLEERDLFLFSPVFELFFMFFYPYLAVSGLFVKKSKWKM
jgi:glycosyltransferase involved in cell wall biosynthesis